MLVAAVPADLPDAVALINMSYRGETALKGWTHEVGHVSGERIGLTELQADLKANPDARLYLARQAADGPLDGCVWLEPAAGDAWYLGLLAVRPDRQDRKLGRAILDEAEAMIRRQGGLRVRITVVQVRETLIAWYQRRGYVLTGETAPFPYPEQALQDLHLVALEKRL